MSNTNVVDQLRTHFENAGAIITENDKFRDQYNLDFAINAIEDIHAHVNLGVHITTDLDDFDAINKFGAASKKGLVLKSIYIEVHPEVADENGAYLVAFGACLTALFDRRHTAAKALGVRINEDCSYQFFNLEDSIQRLERQTEDDLAIGDELDGRIIAYFTDKGFGFIQTDDNRKFFFHIANVVDDDLRSRLPGYVLGEIIPVVFQYGGNDGKKYPKAINVSLSEDADYYYEESEAY